MRPRAIATMRAGPVASTSSNGICRKRKGSHMAQAAKKLNEAPQADFHGTFCWNELLTRDIERAKRFYADTIGWSFEPMQMDWGTYWIAKSGSKKVGGMFELTSPEYDGVPESWMSYVAVDNVDERVAK